MSNRLTVTQWLRELPAAERRTRLRQVFKTLLEGDMAWCREKARDPGLLEMLQEMKGEEALASLLYALRRIATERAAECLMEKFEVEGGEGQ